MAGIARGDVEILVHTKAPSRGQDDARYRALAQAYLDFEPSTRQRLDEGPLSIPVSAEDGQVGSQLQEKLLHSAQEQRDSNASYQPDEEDEDYGSTRSGDFSLCKELDVLASYQPQYSPQLSFNSVNNNADSPLFRCLITQDNVQDILPEYGQGHDTAEPWKTPPSIVADSQPEQEGSRLSFSSPSKVLELYRQNLNSSAHRFRVGTTSHKSRVGEVTSSTPEILEQDTSLPSRVQSSPSPIKSPKRLSTRILRTIDANSPSTHDPGINLKRKRPEPSPKIKPPSSSAPTKLPANSSPVPEDSIGSRKRSRTAPLSPCQADKLDVSLSSKETTFATSGDSTKLASAWGHLLEIRPPPPKTSSRELTADDLITSHLQHLARKMTYSLLYRPRSQTRELRPMERGYWLINCDTWNQGLRKRCWEFLGNYIGKEMAGWGVWCLRSEDSRLLRIYCWGVIVGHIYLLLYMASESKIKGIGARWVGGDGEAVIEMQT